MRFIKPSTLKTASLLLLAGASIAIGDDDESLPVIAELETIVVTASRVEESAFESSFVTESLSDTVLTERAVRSVPEALQQTPGVVVQKTGHAQGSPIVRGFTGYHNLFLIDGVRLNNAAFRSGPNQYWNTVDSQGLSGIELVKSQGSVMFGSDAVGGTIQAITRRPEYADHGFLAGGRSYTRYASGENSVIQRGEASVSEAGKYGLIIGGTYKDFGDIDAADLGKLPNTGYEEWAVDGKFEWFLNDDTRLTLFHQQLHQDDAWRVHKTIFSKSWRGTSVGDERARIFDQDRLLTYARLDASTMTNPLFDRYTVSVSHQRQGEDRYRERADGRFDIQGFELDSYGIWAQFDKALGFSDLVYGFSYYQDRVDSFRDDFHADGSFKGSKIQGSVGDDGVYHLASAFVHCSTPIGDRMIADLGVRYTYARASIGEIESPDTGEQISAKNDWDNIVGSGRLSYRLDEADQWRLFGGVSQAFRAPNFSDLSRLDSNRSTEIETPAPGLSSEEFLTYEIGVKTERDRATASLSYFYTRVEDLIVRTPTGRVVDGLDEVTKLNAGDGHVQGVELSGSYRFTDTVSAFGGFAYQDSQVSAFPTSAPVLRNEPLGRMMPTNGYGGVRVDLADGRAWIEGLVTVVGSGDRLNTRDRSDTQRIPPEGTPGYWLAAVRGGFTFRDNTLVTVGVENIFDEEYRAHGSGQNEPGLNFVFGAEIKF